MGTTDRFVWPPSRAQTRASASNESAPDKPARNDRPPAAKPGRGWRAALLEFERTWLGLTTPPLHIRMAEEGWAPDAPHTYCRRCASTVGPHDADDTGCSECRGKKLEWERVVRLGAFTGLLRDMVLEVKFTRWRRLGHDLGVLLGAAVRRAMDDEGVRSAILVPVPMSTRRRMSRGIDHSMVIARGVAEGAALEVCKGLERDHRPAQARLPASQRRANVAGAIRARPGASLGGEVVIVVDDVTTTRATLTAACRALRKAMGGKGEGPEPRIWGAVLGVTPSPPGK